MKIKQFIEKAIAGGYTETIWSKGDIIDWEALDVLVVDNLINQLALDPKAWEAVGRVEGWKDKLYSRQLRTYASEAQLNMLHMPVALIEGKTLEEFIGTLEPTTIEK